MENNTKKAKIGNIEFNRYGITSAILILQSCIGSIAIFFVMQLPDALNIIPLIFVAVTTMGANAISIAQAPMKWVINSFAVSIIVSIAALSFALVVL